MSCENNVYQMATVLLNVIFNPRFKIANDYSTRTIFADQSLEYIAWFYFSYFIIEAYGRVSPNIPSMKRIEKIRIAIRPE